MADKKKKRPDPPTEFYVEAEQTALTYAYLMAAADRALDDGQSKRPGYGYSFMTATMFAVFSAEAYFNHIGQERMRFWSEHLERLTIAAKADLVNHTLLSRTVEWGQRPYQSLDEAIRYRNALAHGKTETLTSKGIQRMRWSDEPKYPEAKWKKCMTRAVAERVVSDVSGLIETLHKDLGGRGKAFSSLGGGSYTKRFPPGAVD